MRIPRSWLLLCVLVGCGGGEEDGRLSLTQGEFCADLALAQCDDMLIRCVPEGSREACVSGSVQGCCDPSGQGKDCLGPEGEKFTPTESDWAACLNGYSEISCEVVHQSLESGNLAPLQPVACSTVLAGG